ncbi:MAG: RHS repeat protein [Candidatus Rokubacteria bacterium]|nr:RHS repeat protein [Candidatus Rokubacteria bacterium]
MQFVTVTCAEELGNALNAALTWAAGLFGADPVDLATGLFVSRQTDLVIPDVIPIVFTRTYRTNDRDGAFRPFGIASHPYAVYLTGDTATFQYADLNLEDGARIRYYRTSPGTDYASAVMAHTTTPTRFYQSTLAWKVLPSACPGCVPHAVWELRFRDGLLWRFPGTVQPPTDPGPALESIVDRNGNTLTVTRDATFGTRKITRITSPNGRWIDVTTDANVRITQLRDHIGRTVSYAYDGAGNLSSVTDVRGGVTQYTYDASHRLLTIRDARGIVYLTNEYDANGRVSRQTLADGGVYAFSYTPWSAPPPPPPSLTLTQYIWPKSVFATEVSDPRGTVHRYEFFGSGYVQKQVRANGLAEEQTTHLEREDATNLVTAVVDPLGRRTELGYDGFGNITTRRDAVGLPEARILAAAYETVFNRPVSITDALGHTWTTTYDPKGNPVALTDPLGRSVSATYDAQGNLATFADALGNTWTLTSEAGSLTSVKNPLNQTTVGFRDAIGRLVSIVTPAGRRTRSAYDAANLLTTGLGPLGGVTQLTYDANGNPTALSDARGNTMTWSLDSMDRVAVRTDPLGHSQRSSYDAAGALQTLTDHKGQLRTYTRDALGRPILVRFGDGSTRSYTWDAADRLTGAADSQTGALSRTWDALNRLVQETTPQGTVAYTYDAADRRTSMTVSGQSLMTYTYDAGNRVTRMARGTATVTLGYDAAGRRTSLVLPNGVTTTYAYDKASRVVTLTYKKGSTTLGTLTYTYDADGNRTVLGGTWGRTGQPQPMNGATYDAANQQLTFGTTTLTYDENGNLTTITDTTGVTTLTWDARDQLAALSASNGLTASFVYDGLARRVGKTLNGTTTTYLYDGPDAVREVGSSLPVDYLRSLAIDEPLARDVSEFYLADGLGSIVALTNAAGVVTTSYTYEAFGSAATAGSTSGNAIGFTGRELDGTGLYYYRARYYDPRLARFVSPDPFLCAMTNVPPLKAIKRNPQVVNAFAYVTNSPVNQRDPLGLTPECDYYRQRCKETGSFYYCTLAPPFCERTPRGPVANCYRQCLQDFDRDVCVPIFGRKDPYGLTGACAEVGGHAACMFGCVISVDPPGPPI